MPIYDKPTKQLMQEFAAETLNPGQIFGKLDAVAWFEKRYPRIRSTTVRLYVGAMAVNVAARKRNANLTPQSGLDLFFRVGPGQYRLWDPKTDPPPIYRAGHMAEEGADPNTTEVTEDEEEVVFGAGSEFAYERDLRNYLSRNLEILEPSLQLFEEEGITGMEFPVGGRFIDLLAVDNNGDFVVIELKVSRGYDRTIGQLLRYMAWVKQNLAEDNTVRGIIVASEITDDLKLAASLISDVKMVEYEIAFKMKPVALP